MKCLLLENLRAIRLLLENGANVDIVNNIGLKARDIAEQRGFI